MTTENLPATLPETGPGSLPSRTGDLQSLLLAVSRWAKDGGDPPENVTHERLDAGVAELGQETYAADREAIAICLDRLFSVFPMPSTDALAIWYERIEARGTPAGALYRAVDRIIDTHRYPTAPALATLIETALADEPLRSTLVDLQWLRGAKWKLDHQPKLLSKPIAHDAPPLKELPPARVQKMPRPEPTKVSPEILQRHERDKARVLAECEAEGMLDSVSED